MITGRYEHDYNMFEEYPECEFPGECVIIRDVFGRLVDTVRVLKSGIFQTAEGPLEAGAFGDYVLRKAFHTTGTQSPKPLGPISDLWEEPKGC